MGKRLAFAHIQVGETTYLCVFDYPPKVSCGSIVRVVGTKIASLSSTSDFEINVVQFEVVSPFIPSLGNAHCGRGENKYFSRHVEFRNSVIRERFKKRALVIGAIRAHLGKCSFVEVTSPKIVGSISSAPVMRFKVDFFGSEAYLSISNLLYHAAFIAGDFEKIYELGPLFRADINQTTQHISEFTILEITASLQTRETFIALCDDLVRLSMTVCGIPVSPSEIPVLRYNQAVAICNEAGERISWGERLKRRHAKRLSNILCSELYWIIDMPGEHRNFFSSVRFDKEIGRQIANDFRLFYVDVDIVDGAERIFTADALVDRLRSKGLEERHYEYYISILRTGVAPFTGLGFGLDRLIARILGLSNVRDVIAFPRFYGHLEP